MQRRSFIVALSSAPWAATQAQVSDLGDAINKAGRQRMLSQRMGKAWLALLQGVEPDNARQVLDKSMALFDRQLVELKAFAPTADNRATYHQLDAAWSDYKAALVGGVPSKANANALLAQDARVLALAHQGTLQLEATLGKPLGKLVNMAGRQRMLSQRMAKFYLAARLPIDAPQAAKEISQARGEFVAAMVQLRQAPEATPRILEALVLADAQWLFFDNALTKLKGGQGDRQSMADVFVTSENLLSVMDGITGMYASLRA